MVESLRSELAEETGQDLPRGWVLTTLGEAASVNARLNAVRDLPDGLPVTFVPMAAVDAESGTIREAQERRVSEVKKGYTPFKDGDVLFAKITPCMENGKAAVARDLLNGYGFGSTEFHVLSPTRGVLSEWLFYFVRQLRFREDAKARFTGTAGQLRVPAPFLQAYPLPLAPLAEQCRIVAAIETQFTRLDAGVAALRRVQAALKRYRAAVLKAAVEGKLTEEWRATHPDVESAPALLERILHERRQAWEQAELDRYARTGKTPPKGWRERYHEPAGPDTMDLPGLPEGWCWASVGQVATLITKGSSPGWQGFKYANEGILFLRSQNVRWGVLDLTDLVYLPQEFNQTHQNSIIHSGDVLLNLVGASIGRSSIATEQINNANTNQAVGIIRLIPGAISNALLMYYLISPQGQAYITVNKADVARANFNLDDIKLMRCPLPPLAEQEQIVAEVDRRLSVVAEVEAAVQAQLRRAERLRQSILKRAFAGQLVPQDPSDEPAGALLERIRRERAARANGRARGEATQLPLSLPAYDTSREG